MLYVLRVGVIEQLGESGQRLLLNRLAGVLGAPLGQFTPVGVVTLEAMALLLEVLGEVSADKRAELEPAIGAKVAGPHACLRLQAAAAVAALAVAEPSSAARLVSASLANLDAALNKLVEATASAPPDRSRPAVPGTPRGVGSAKLKPDMNAVHGWAVSGAALVAASRRLPLGVPASLLASVLEYATRLITTPQSQQVGIEKTPHIDCRSLNPISAWPVDELFMWTSQGFFEELALLSLRLHEGKGLKPSLPCPRPAPALRRPPAPATHPPTHPPPHPHPHPPACRAWWPAWSGRRGTSCWLRCVPHSPLSCCTRSQWSCCSCSSRLWEQRPPPSWTGATAAMWWVPGDADGGDGVGLHEIRMPTLIKPGGDWWQVGKPWERSLHVFNSGHAHAQAARCRAMPPVQSSLDHVVAMELWWRSAALQALAACTLGPVAAASSVQQPALLRRAAALLKPTLDVLTAHAALQVRSSWERQARDRKGVGRETACHSQFLRPGARAMRHAPAHA